MPSPDKNDSTYMSCKNHATSKQNDNSSIGYKKTMSPPDKMIVPIPVVKNHAISKQNDNSSIGYGCEEPCVLSEGGAFIHNLYKRYHFVWEWNGSSKLEVVTITVLRTMPLSRL